MIARFMRGWRVIAASALILAVAAASVALGLGSREPVVPYAASGQTLFGVRPTAVGLPNVGQSGTVGVDALTAPLRSYHDSGAYELDVAAVDGAARRYIAHRLAATRNYARLCAVSYVPVRNIAGHGTLYQRLRRCRPSVDRLTGKPALVLDIDETSLSNYADLSAKNFDAAALALSAATGHGTTIAPTLRLYRDAIARKVAVFFVTGRPQALESITQSNLRKAGYDKGWSGFFEEPASAGVERFKSAARATIQRRGYDIVANVGDQQSDLDGGHADRDFKLPNPFYFIAD
jgi:HAD superfamily, subfamily IIIB (Acid phosphatase)